MKTMPQCQPTPPEICEKESEENGVNVSYIYAPSMDQTINSQPKIKSMLVSIISSRKQWMKKQVKYNLSSSYIQKHTSVVINNVGLMKLFDNQRKHTKFQVDRYAATGFCIAKLEL